MSLKAELAARAVSRLRLGKGRREAQLVLRDGSYLHFRHDRHSHWVQATSDGLAAGLNEGLESFEYHRAALRLYFEDGSQLHVGHRFRRLVLRTLPPQE